MTIVRVETKKVHDINHIPKPIKPDTIARIESESRADTTCAGKKMTLFS